MQKSTGLATLKQALDALVSEGTLQASRLSTLEALEQHKIAFLGKQGHLTRHAQTLSTLPKECRAQAGAVINGAKAQLLDHFQQRQTQLHAEGLARDIAAQRLDVTLPGRALGHGALHPITQTCDRITQYFVRMGFQIAQGPEIEDCFHNFDALRVPVGHPARDPSDTFWFDHNRLLRTHTSGIQIRTMQTQTAPLRLIAPGRVYRRDSDQTHTPMFHQVEGLMVAESLKFSDLKGVMSRFLRDFFAPQTLTIRFNPSFFPFTEPSAEVNIQSAEGKWLEVLGCGMVHPEVLEGVQIDPERYSGFAFGLGVERFAMLRYGLSDLRAFFENDLRLLSQF